MSDTSLEEIFTGDAPADAPATPEAEAPETPAVETPGVEAPQIAETTDATEQPETPETPREDPKTVPHEALHAERAKRQAAEEARQTLEKRFNALTEQVGALLPHLSKLGGKEPPAEKPKLDFYTDPQAFVTENLTGLETRINQSLGSVLMTISEQQAKLRHDDYDQTLQTFADLTKERPDIRQQLRSVPDPAEWAYNFVKKHEALQAVGDDPAAYEKSLREKWEAEQAQAAETATPAPALPKSLAKARSVGAGARSTGPGWQGPTPLDAALAGVPGRAKK